MAHSKEKEHRDDSCGVLDTAKRTKVMNSADRHASKSSFVLNRDQGRAATLEQAIDYALNQVSEQSQ